MYQTFDDQNGSSNSPAKWDALKLSRLDGLSVLDLGCNEGFFTAKAHEKGAAYVVGIDADSELIERAKQRNPELNFENAPWDQYLRIAGSDSFDVVIMLSAFHYVSDRQRFLKEIHRVLRNNGIFVIEVGLVENPLGQAMPIDRGTPPATDRVWHLTPDAFIKQFKSLFAVRLVGESVTQPGDPIRRFVFHCTKRKPWMLFVRGPSGAGKSDLAELLADGKSVHMISLDQVAQAITTPTEPVGLQPRDIRQDIGSIVESTDLCDDVINSILFAVPPGAEVCVVEGCLLENSKFYSRMQKAAQANNFRIATTDIESPSYYEIYKNILL